MCVRSVIVVVVLLLAGSPEVVGAQGQVVGDSASHLEAARKHRLAGRFDLAVQELKYLLAGLEGDPQEKTLTAMVHREWGEIHLAQRNLRQAISSFEHSLALDPAQPVLHYQAGISYQRLGESANGAAHLEQAVKQGFDNVGTLFHLVSANFASGQQTAALERSRQLLERTFASADIPFRLGRLLLEQLFYSDALEAFRLAHKQARDSYEIQFYLALTFHLLGRYEDAINLLTPLADNPGTPEVRALNAAALAYLGAYEQAAALLQQAIENNPSSAHALLNLALVKIETGEVDAAEELLERLRHLDSGSDVKVFYTIQRDTCPRSEGDLQDEHGPVQSDPDKALYLTTLGDSFQRRHHYSTAAALLKLARRYEAESSHSLYSLAVSCLNLDPTSRAAALMLRRAAELDPGRHETWYMLGRAYKWQEKDLDAIDALRRATQLDPQSSAYFTELGEALAARTDSEQPERLEGALQALERAIELDRNNGIAHYELGKLLMRLDRFEAALRHFETAIEAEPEFYEAYYQLGLWHARMKNSQESREYLEAFRQRKETANRHSAVSAGFVRSAR